MAHECDIEKYLYWPSWLVHFVEDLLKQLVAQVVDGGGHSGRLWHSDVEELIGTEDIIGEFIY